MDSQSCSGTRRLIIDCSGSAGNRQLAVHRILTVSLPSVADSRDLDRICGFIIEKHAIVAAAETKTDARGLKLLHVANAVGQIAVNAVQNLHRRFPINCSQLSASLGRPSHGDPGCLSGHLLSPNSRSISPCGMPSPRASEARARSSAAAVSDVIASSSTGTEASERDTGSTIT